MEFYAADMMSRVNYIVDKDVKWDFLQLSDHELRYAIFELRVADIRVLI